MQVIAQEAQERLVLLGRDLATVHIEAVGCHLSSSLEALGNDAEDIVDDPTRALGRAHAAGDAVLLVDNGEVVGHVNRIRRAGPLAGTAGDAAYLAHRSHRRANLVVGAEHLDALVTRNDVDDVLFAHAGAQAAANAGVAVHVRHAVLVELDRVHAAGGDTCATPNASI